jgi:murein L,D-transpeptidase YafK
MSAVFPPIKPGGKRKPRAILPVIGLGLLILLFAAMLCPNAAMAQDPPPAAPAKDISPAKEVLNYCYQGKVGETRLVVVNKSLQRIMVFRYMGKLMLEYEFPVATGTNNGAKIKQGDERTPVGIYFTTHRYQDRKITIFGDRAIHLNYPNPVDQLEGKKGNGIYIHGTNQDLRKRSSNGCITLRNKDLAVIEPMITEQLTPVIVVERLQLAELTERDQACDQLRKLEGALNKGPARMEPYLALAGNGHEHKKLLASLAPKLASLDMAKNPPAKVQNKGLILLGLGEQWVLVADQVLQGPKHHSVSVTRRFYLSGPQAPEAQLIRGDWVVPNLASAKTLASWAPKAEIVKPLKPPAPAGSPAVASEKQIQRTIKQWMAAWQAKNLKRYMSYYAARFKGDGKNRSQWRKRKAYLNKVYKEIRVSADKLRITVKGNRAEVSFVQHYRSDWHKDVGKKTMVWVNKKGRWQILREDWNKLPGRAGGASLNGRRSS